jgi:hypothetical protein
MKTVAGGIILAVVFFAAGAVAFAEARLARQIAEAHQRLATLHYDTNDGIDAAATPLAKASWLGGSLAADVDRHRTLVQYWRAQYDVLKPLTTMMASSQTTRDPAVMLIAANAAFRASHPEAGERKGAIERLDTVMQAYADVLRADPNAVDAAYNYEYVVRMREMLAKAKGARSKDFKTAEAEIPSVDLPTGPTIHGRPGGPPPTVPMNDFKTITPMRFDEREEQALPGRGAAPRRRG